MTLQNCGFAELSLLAEETKAVLLAAERADGDYFEVFRLLNAGTRLATIMSSVIESLERHDQHSAAKLLGYVDVEEDQS